MRAKEQKHFVQSEQQFRIGDLCVFEFGKEFFQSGDRIMIAFQLLEPVQELSDIVSRHDRLSRVSTAAISAVI